VYSHWLTRLVERPGLRVALSVVFGLGVVFRGVQVVVGISGPAWGYDFSAYWLASLRVINEQPLYLAAQLSGPFSPQEHFAYLYPPLLAVVLSPLPLLFSSYQTAMFAWAGAGLLILVGSVAVLARSDHRARSAVVILILAAVALPATGFELVMGNVHLLMVGLLAAAWLLLSRATRRGDISGGALLAVAALIKVFPALLIAWLLLRGKFAAAAGFVGAAGLLVVGSLPFVGPQAWFDYPVVLANVGPPPELWSSIAPASFAAGVIDFNLARVAVLVTGLVILVWSTLRQPTPISFGVAVMVAMLVVPTMYVHYLALAILPMTLLALHARSWIAPAAAYGLLFIGTQVALIDLEMPLARYLALAGAIAPLLALLLYGSGPTRAATPAAPFAHYAA
jgi:glycosyl transferase family 87